MIEISKIEVKGKFRYLWLKSIKGVDLSVHCARCLIGKYDNRIYPQLGTSEHIVLTEKIYYLCGVSDPYVWENNFHLAFQEKAGASLNISRNGINIIINGAEEIQFSEKDIDLSLPQAKRKEYTTCRNWQFANKLRRNENFFISKY